MRKATIAVVVPAFNEERVIKKSLQSLKKVINKKHIYVVSDGSIDDTAKIARTLTDNVLSLRKNRGKAGAIEALVKKFSLPDRYQYIFFFDADTRVDKQFVPEIKKIINRERPACVVGTVASEKNNYISAYRVFEYGFSHKFFKNAQNQMGVIVVAPGCTSVYRSDVLAKLDFSRKTLTEDLDFTIQIHKYKYGKIRYCPKAKVYTQDPPTLRDFWKQISRWNTGFWQNFFNHKLFLPNSKFNFEVLLLLADFALWMLILALAITKPLVLLATVGISAIIAAILAIATITIERQYWALIYVPLFTFFQILNTISLIHSFFRAVFGRNRSLSWQKVTRYAN